MTLWLIAGAFLAAFLGGIIYSIVGIIPGTDETATMAPCVTTCLGLSTGMIEPVSLGVVV